LAECGVRKSWMRKPCMGKTKACMTQFQEIGMKITPLGPASYATSLREHSLYDHHHHYSSGLDGRSVSFLCLDM
jgi:hypothetical protein